MADKLIFFVDDEPMFINLLEYTIKGKAGYAVVSFRSAEECLAQMFQNPDLVVVDYFLHVSGSHMTGLDLMKKIRETNPNTLLVFLTGNDDPAVMSEAKSLGAERYILKDGYFIDNLKDCIAELLPVA